MGACDGPTARQVAPGPPIPTVSTKATVAGSRKRPVPGRNPAWTGFPHELARRLGPLDPGGRPPERRLDPGTGPRRWRRADTLGPLGWWLPDAACRAWRTHGEAPGAKGHRARSRGPVSQSRLEIFSLDSVFLRLPFAGRPVRLPSREVAPMSPSGPGVCRIRRNPTGFPTRLTAPASLCRPNGTPLSKEVSCLVFFDSVTSSQRTNFLE